LVCRRVTARQTYQGIRVARLNPQNSLEMGDGLVVPFQPG
jgi:hypothetical protein